MESVIEMSEKEPLYCLKMRASENVDGKDVHISGAEKIIKEQQLNTYTNALIERGLHHAKGNADFINLKVEKIEADEVTYLEALPVTTVEVDTWQEGQQEILKYLEEIGVKDPFRVMDFLKETYAMRGAMLLDVRRFIRLEPDKERGIRATYMDQERTDENVFLGDKDHYAEAIVLATKVVNCPGIIGEICISDDPDYVTGYVSSKTIGYRRITKMKELGSENGGRIFLYDGEPDKVDEAIDFLQKKKIIVRGVKKLSIVKNGDSDSRNTDKAENSNGIENTTLSPLDRLEKNLSVMKENNLYRTMKAIETAQGSHIAMNGREYVLMASNSYLDITSHPHMIDSCKKALDKYGFGSGGSRLTTGNTDLHEKLERKIAEFKECEAAIVFNTGYVANVAVISAIMREGGIIFSDELNHASIIDGCRLSKVKCVVYKHNDMEDLKRKINENPCEFGLVVSDAVFSMDGDILKLPEFVEICEENNLLSMVDEAHSTGVIGETGHGIVEYFGNVAKPDIIMGTLSKSVGGEGGFVAGKKIIIDYLRNTARGFIFSTSLSMVTVAADIAGIEIIEKEPELVKRLQNNVRFFCKCLQENGLNISSETAIVPIVIGDEKKAMDLSSKLLENGFFISAIRYPTVAKGQARLRVALMASHTEAELRKAAELICSNM